MGVSNPTDVSLLEAHMHSDERWMGKSADQSGDDWCLIGSLTPFRAISGNGDFGGDADDEAKVIGLDDTPHIPGKTFFAVHRIMVTAASNATDFVLRVIYGTGTMADAEAAGQYSSFMVQEAKKGLPVRLQMLRRAIGIKIWIRAKNATDNATIDFFVGVHEYDK